MSHMGSKCCSHPAGESVVYYYPLPYSYSFCPSCCKPHHLCSCHAQEHLKVPQELAVESASATKFVGGLRASALTLEYLKTGTSPTLKVTLAEGSETVVWEVTGIADGYQIKEDLTTASPGTSVKIEATNCTARLRWCEVIAC